MSAKRTILAVASIAIVVLIILISIGIFIVERERDYKEDSEMAIRALLNHMKWEAKCEKDAIRSYEEYTRDNETMNAFFTLREINPFIKEQMPYLREYMKILHDNVTIGNYEIAHYQFRICNAMDKTYSENYSFYFQQIDEKYENMTWLNYRSVPYINQGGYWEIRDRYLFAFESNYDSDHDEGFELEYYTNELEYYEEQINYIYDTFISQ